MPEWLEEGRSARCSMVCMPSRGAHVTSGVPKGETGVWASEGGWRIHKHAEIDEENVDVGERSEAVRFKACR